MARTKSFSDACYELLLRVPAGRVTTYGELAVALGSRAYRAVGNAMHRNPNAPRVPCHRVVRSDGTLGGYALGTKKKAELLRQEGVIIEQGRVANFAARVYHFKK